MSAEQPVFEDFKDRVGSSFAIIDPQTPRFTLTLDEANLLPARGTAPGARPPFSLIFVGSGEHVLPQKLYRLEHAGMGEIDIFLVPVGKGERGISYQALFN